jgi:hypothetical protein
MAKQLVQYNKEIDVLDVSQKKSIIEKTPKEYIKQRPGRGGMKFDYVEIGYVIDKLNQIFNYHWEFDILEDKVYEETGQVVVKGQLTVYTSKDFSLKKTQYGSADIKMQNGKPMSIGDDLKSAGSDALKKCASLIGIASDVYWGEKSNIDFSNEPQTDHQRKKMFAMENESGLPEEKLRELLFKVAEVTSHKDLNMVTADKWIYFLENKLLPKIKNEN